MSLVLCGPAPWLWRLSGGRSGSSVRRWLYGLLLVCGCVVAAEGWSGPPVAPMRPSPAQQQALDAAVTDYGLGRFEQARTAFERLAEAGVAAAHYNLGVMQLRRESASTRPGEAVEHLERAAAGGFVTAQFALGEYYESGRYARPDLPRAMTWYQRAAESGSTDAQVAIATGYYLGRGVPHDAARALHWYREAAKAGDVGAQYLLASMYEKGEGTSIDLRLAHYWYDIAARSGDVAAPGKRDEVARRMAPGSGRP